jgi:catechol 2,3-dioxygenase-like lactoylglutathione lyase family enzyme
MSRTVQVTFDCADPNALASFWNQVLGYEYDAPPAGFATWDEALEHFGVPEDERNNASACHDPDGKGPRLYFQKVPEGKSAKNRVHLDVRAAPGMEGDERMAALESECERLVELGATRLKRFDPDPPMGQGTIVMQDPEGNEFCLD